MNKGMRGDGKRFNMGKKGYSRTYKTSGSQCIWRKGMTDGNIYTGNESKVENGIQGF